MLKNKVNLRPIEREDLEWMRKLRNDNRKFFFEGHYLQAAEQVLWYEKYLKRVYPVTTFYIISIEDQPVGTISINESDDIIQLGNILIEENARHKQVFQTVMKYLKGKYRSKFEIEVKADNKYVIAVYGLVGFKPYGLRMRT